MHHSFCVCDTSPHAAFSAQLRNPSFEKMSTDRKHYEQRTERAFESGPATRPDEYRASRGLPGFQAARPSDPRRARVVETAGPARPQQ